MEFIYKYIISNEKIRFCKYLSLDDDIEEFEFELLKDGFEFVRVFWLKRN